MARVGGGMMTMAAPSVGARPPSSSILRRLPILMPRFSVPLLRPLSMLAMTKSRSSSAPPGVLSRGLLLPQRPAARPAAGILPPSSTCGHARRWRAGSLANRHGAGPGGGRRGGAAVTVDISLRPWRSAVVPTVPPRRGIGGRFIRRQLAWVAEVGIAARGGATEVATAARLHEDGQRPTDNNDRTASSVAPTSSVGASGRGAGATPVASGQDDSAPLLLRTFIDSAQHPAANHVSLLVGTVGPDAAKIPGIEGQEMVMNW